MPIATWCSGKLERVNKPLNTTHLEKCRTVRNGCISIYLDDQKEGQWIKQISRFREENGII